MSVYNYDIQTITLTPTVTASNAYGTNYVVGGLLTFPLAYPATGNIILQAVGMTCKKVESSGFSLAIFNSNPSNSTWTDASVAAINASDVAKVVAILPLSSSSALGTHTISTATSLALPTQSFKDRNLYAVLLSNASLTNQFGSTSDVTVFLQVLQSS